MSRWPPDGARLKVTGPPYLAFALAAATGVVLALLGVRNPAYFVGDLALAPAFVLIIVRLSPSPALDAP